MTIIKTKIIMNKQHQDYTELKGFGKSKGKYKGKWTWQDSYSKGWQASQKGKSKGKDLTRTGKPVPTWQQCPENWGEGSVQSVGLPPQATRPDRPCATTSTVALGVMDGGRVVVVYCATFNCAAHSSNHR